MEDNICVDHKEKGTSMGQEEEVIITLPIVEIGISLGFDQAEQNDESVDSGDHVNLQTAEDCRAKLLRNRSSTQMPKGEETTSSNSQQKEGELGESSIIIDRYRTPIRPQYASGAERTLPEKEIAVAEEKGNIILNYIKSSFQDRPDDPDDCRIC